MSNQQEIRDAAFALGKLLASGGIVRDAIDYLAHGYADGHQPEPGTVEPAPLEQVKILQKINSAAQGIVAWRVDDSRDAGHSWAEIGEALGMTRQAAHKRFSE